jgi:Flp pilus assembly protein TadD
LNPNNAGAYNDRGRAYWNKGDKTQARADWNKALQIDPNNLSAKLYLARYH